MSDIAQSLGNRIRDLRKQKRMSQEELAYKACISPAHLGQIERALKNPTLNTIAQIAAALDISLSEMFAFDSLPAPIAEESTIIEKINTIVGRMSTMQQRHILKIIRILQDFDIE